MTTEQKNGWGPCGICADPSIKGLLPEGRITVGMHAHDLEENGTVNGFIRMSMDVDQLPEIMDNLAHAYEKIKGHPLVVGSAHQEQEEGRHG